MFEVGRENRISFRSSRCRRGRGSGNSVSGFSSPPGRGLGNRTYENRCAFTSTEARRTPQNGGCSTRRLGRGVPVEAAFFAARRTGGGSYGEMGSFSHFFILALHVLL